MVRMFVLVSWIAVMLSGWCHAAKPATAPSTAATSRPSTPQEAARQFMIAFDGGDERTTRALLATDNKLESEAADVWAASTTGQFALRRLVFEKFGVEGLRVYDDGRTVPPPSTREQIRKNADDMMKILTVKVDGDSAMFEHPQHPEQPLKLRKVSGGWAVTFSSMHATKSPAESQRYISLNRSSGPIYRGVIDDVKSGKLKSAKAVREAVDDREVEDAKRRLDQTQPPAGAAPAAQPKR